MFDMPFVRGEICDVGGRVRGEYHPNEIDILVQGKPNTSTRPAIMGICETKASYLPWAKS